MHQNIQHEFRNLPHFLDLMGSLFLSTTSLYSAKEMRIENIQIRSVQDNGSLFRSELAAFPSNSGRNTKAALSFYRRELVQLWVKCGIVLQ